MKKHKKAGYTRKMKMVAIMLLLIFTVQLVLPNVSYALTTGPSQPEVQSFEPVGTTDMVDMFSGDFVYNIPLLDVEGYPVNISYHGGVTMEQEASWVGLGWNINPGAINRTVRGLPDDFNGDTLSKDLNINPETTLRIGVGGGVELAGIGDPALDLSLSAGVNINVSNYRGVSSDVSFGGNISVMHCVSAGVNLGVGSQTGASIDYNAGLSVSSSQLVGTDAAGVGIGVAGGYSSRSGIKDLNLSFSITTAIPVPISTSATIPIGVKNYVPVVTNSSTMSTIYGRVKLGGEAFTVYPYGNINAMSSRLTYKDDASRDAYGYMYLQNAPTTFNSILDFTRDKDGMFNKTMEYLPPPTMTYDIYTVSGQGTGGMFRPFRNDFGSVYDPNVLSTSTSEGGGVEAALGDLFEVGLDYSSTNTDITSGPWSEYQRTGVVNKSFAEKRYSKVFENVYFKQGGELTPVDSAYFAAIGGTDPITPHDALSLPSIKPNSMDNRDIRGNLMYYYTGSDVAANGVGTDAAIINYMDPDFSHYADPPTQAIKRVDNRRLGHKKDQISEIVQLQKDGKRYVYGLPAMNNVQKEVTFSVDPTSDPVDLGAGLVTYTDAEASIHNNRGKDHYYSATVTPSYAHSYLLTSVLSKDYVDVKGDGPTDDDLGDFTKFNYTRSDSDYRWCSPTYDNKAQYNPGYWSDPLDDKASFVCGSREQWNLHSIETKNFIAEFYTSKRKDGKGLTKKILSDAGDVYHGESPYNDTKGSGSYSYELDSIKLFNKHDRFINKAAAIPIKTVYLAYDYSQCPHIPNSDDSVGKLTLKRIYFSYGSSQKSMLSPYKFDYSNNDAFNYPYNPVCKDRWGNYKPSGSPLTNYEFPYVNQNDPADSAYASAWSLTRITLPSGGAIQANYESDDYAYVQDKVANEMFIVQGLGNSKAHIAGTSLYTNASTPNLYAYFLRRKSSESPGITFAQNYLSDLGCMYFNFNLSLTGAQNTYEQIKGYATLTDIGVCSNDSSYGYIKFQPASPTGGGANLNPVTYTAINTSRYTLPQVVFPGSDPTQSDMENMLAGLKGSFKELAQMSSSPVTNMANKGYAKTVNINKSFIRLQSVGGKKKGGGQRVKQLSFYDAWSTLAGGNEVQATYGKNYDYTVYDDAFKANISSGVASYEPMVGGDENPLRKPVKFYTAQSGSNWPPNDPVELYQEAPIGESFYPSPQVGYSQITVTSIHQANAKSSQGIDKYLFYTAKDFPAQFMSTGIQTTGQYEFHFFSQSNTLKATQGYSLVFNDMHGKPKRVEHGVMLPKDGSYHMISYQQYNYKTSNNQLDNNVNCLVYDGGNMVVKQKRVGIEEDFTMDSRQKDEETHTLTVNGNLNVFLLWIVPIPVPWVFPWNEDATNEFQSAATTKIVQQYGILDNVESYNEGAYTKMQNELYDPNTGQVVVTSVNNEYTDKEYNVNVPAYWVYQPFSPAYSNIQYKDTGKIVVHSDNYMGELTVGNSAPLQVGDELSVDFTDGGGTKQHTTAWVMGPLYNYGLNVTTHPDSTLVYDTGTVYTPILNPCYTPNDITKEYIQTGFIPNWDTCRPFGLYAGGPYPFGVQDSTYIEHTLYLNNGSDCIHGADTSFWANMQVYGGRWQTPDYPCSNVPGSIIPICNQFVYDITQSVYVNIHNGIATGTMTLYDSLIFSTPNSGYVLRWSYTFPFSDTLTYTGHTDTMGYTVSHPITSHYNHFIDTIYTPTRTCGAPIGILPRFPKNTPGWAENTTLTNVTIQVVNSGNKNRLSENTESYTMMDNPVDNNNLLKTIYIGNVVNLKAWTYADSNTRLLNFYEVNGDTLNPYAIGERGIWRMQDEYAYVVPRNYSGTTARNSGLFDATTFFTHPYANPLYQCTSFPFNYLQPINMVQVAPVAPQWQLQHSITKYSPIGKEIENKDALGIYSTAVYGFNEALPVAVASNAKQGEILSDGFEDYNLLQPEHSIMNFRYSPFNRFDSTSMPSAFYFLLNLSNPTALRVTTATSHTGLNSLLTPNGSPYNLSIPVNLPSSYAGLHTDYNMYYPYNNAYPTNIDYTFSAANEYLPFCINIGEKYIISYWMKPVGAATDATAYTIDNAWGTYQYDPNLAGQPPHTDMKTVSGIIDGWQQVETIVTLGPFDTGLILRLPPNYYIDDIRAYPATANMKSFVYHPVNEKLMATLDENNFATIYEYDQEGNLVRTKKETSKGIMTISESRSGNPKQ